VRWLGECPGWYDTAFDVLTRDGLVTRSQACWTLDLAAMTESDGDQEIWRRSRLALVRDEARPRVLCFACHYEPTDAELVALALPFIG